MKALKITGLTILIIGLITLATSFILGFTAEDAKDFFTEDKAFVLQEEITYTTLMHTIDVDMDIRNLTIETHDESYLSINHYRKSNETWTITENEGILSIKQKTKSPFVSFRFLISKNKNTVFISVPKEWIIDYTLKSNTGNISITEVQANILNVSVDTGNVYIKGSSILKTLTSKSSTGSIKVENTNISETLKSTTNTGSITILKTNAHLAKLKTETGSIRGDTLNAKTLKVEASTGSITLKGAYKDYSLSLKTSTGSIKVDGSSKNKIYNIIKGEESITAKTSTGSITISYDE